MLSSIFNSKDLKHFMKLLGEAENIVLTCHVRPDGDAIGSTLGLALLLGKLGKHASVVTPDSLPRSLSFLPNVGEIVAATRYPAEAARLINESDLILCLDFNKPSRQDELAPIVQGSSAPKVLIDHHQFPDDFAEVTFSYPEMSSTCELVFRLIAACGWICELDVKAATCLLTGIITDTRNFSVNCDNPELYFILMELLKLGVNKQRIIREALETKSLDCFRLQNFALANKLELFEKHRCALITLSKEDLERFKYQRGDTEGLVNTPLQIRKMVYCIFMREDSDCIKVSARSVNKFPVSKICEDLYGGGGHLQAAGGEFHGSLDECRQLLIEEMPRYDKYLTKQE